jgi:2-oxoglutarate dehydrogenase E2 component (dihydrolipoamide succinyltransferase)
MPITITMPQLGETVTEGTILEWVKQVGEHVAEDDILVEISTDKVDTEVPSPAAGVITEILIGAGETVAVGTAIAILTEADGADAPVPNAEPPSEAASASDPSSSGSAAASASDPSSVVRNPSSSSPPSAGSEGDTSQRSVLSPVVRKLAGEHSVDVVVRKLAGEHSVDVAMVRGTGHGGRVTRKDVEAFIASRGDAAVTAPPPRAPTQAVAPPPARVDDATGDVREVSRIRERIAQNMTHAKQAAAHVWTSVEVDYERVERVRSAHRESFKANEGFSLTYLPFIVRAMTDALAAYPVVNSTLDLDGGTHTFTRAVHLGVAVDLDQEGLVVVTVRDADAMTLKAVARSVRNAGTRARSGDLGPDDLAGSTFTVTNPGPFGSHLSIPIINVPNAAILSTDTIKKRPVVVEMPDGSDSIAIHHMGYLGMSWDHRVFDGSTAVMFLNRIKDNLESWDWEQELS